MNRHEGSLEYILTFSSSYKAMYARDKLAAHGIYGDLRRVPAELVRTCGQALHLAGCDLQRVTIILAESQIEIKEILTLTYIDGIPEYKRIR